MSADATRAAIRVGSLALGLVLFVAAFAVMDLRMVVGTIHALGIALPLALSFSGLCHLARTWAWVACLPRPLPVPFLHVARVRLSAEAFSYLTFRGIAGEPLKVVLLSGSVSARDATAAVALERLAYIAGTTVLAGAGAVVAMLALPLTAGWFRIFGGLAIMGAAVTVFALLVVAGRGSYVASLLCTLDRLLGTSVRVSKVSGAIMALERQMLEIARGNRRRLLTLIGATAASFLFTALEGWVLLRAAGEPVTAIGALTVETFSRAASFASAFIPANVGALEASSVAAVMAVGAAGGGASLAVGRRLRGLFWAGLGLAVYPRRFNGASAFTTTDSTSNQGATRMLLYLPTDPSVPVPPSARLAGLAIAERMVRAAARAGYTRMVLWAPGTTLPGSLLRRLRKLAAQLRLGLEVATCLPEWDAALASAPPAGGVTVAGAGTVVSPALLERARELPPIDGRCVDVAAGPDWPESGVLRMPAADARDWTLVVRELAARRDRALPLPSGADVSRKRAMLAIRIVHHADLARAEETIRRSSYKETDGVLARFNRQISLPISVALLRTPLTANQLSIALVAVGFYSGWLFSLGHYWTGVAAAFLSLAASVLDGCDGEIARLKYQESRLGCWIETVGDYSYYLAIFVGLTIGVARQTHASAFHWLGAIALAGTLLSFAMLIFLRSRTTGGHPEQLSAVMQKRFLSEPTLLSRIIVQVSFAASRAGMPYGIMAFALVNALPGIVILAAIGANVYWISLAVKMRDLLGGHERCASLTVS